MSEFIGRGEVVVSEILDMILPMPVIKEQPSLQSIISEEDFNFLDEIYQKHKFDLRADYFSNWNKPEEKLNMKTLMVEVNYKHKEGAARKWSNVFLKLLKKYHITPVTINDYNCRSSIPKTKGIFYLDSKKHHGPITWNDVRDVIDALEKAGIDPHGL